MPNSPKDSGIELTICSVFHNPQSKRYVDVNQEFTAAINPASRWMWSLADNSSDPSIARTADPAKFQLMKGISREELINSLPEELHGKLIVNSYHHAVAINKQLRQVKTRFALILDSDLYIVRQNWIRDVLNHMKENSLGFFGVPFHPLWWTKFRYFPSPNCIFIDMEKVPAEKLDFNPEYTSLFEDSDKKNSFSWSKSFRERRKIGALKETGFKVYAAFHKSNTLYECVVSLFNPDENASGLKLAAKRFLRAVFPDSWQFAPKRSGYWAPTSFKEMGYFDIQNYGGEEFIWQEAPFAFHVRHFKKSKRILAPEEELSIINEALKSFIEYA